MKTMTCKELGGACDMKFQADTFEEMAQLSKEHGMQMFQQQDEDHFKIIQEMTVLMQDPEAMQKWFENKRQEFESLPED